MLIKLDDSHPMWARFASTWVQRRNGWPDFGDNKGVPSTRRELFDMRAHKLMAGMVIAGGLAAAAVGVGAGTAAAAPASATGPIPAWGPPPPPGPGWGHHDDRGRGWGPPDRGWRNEGPWGPAGWNGGWQPPGAVCLGEWCI